MKRKTYIYLIALFMCFCQNLAAMNEVKEDRGCSDRTVMNEVCAEIEEAINYPLIINQTFADYKKERGEQPLMLLFPGGRTVRNSQDLRGKQQEHQGFYTIDLDLGYDNKCNPHLEGSIFSEKLWEEIEDNSLDLIHIEIPSVAFLLGSVDYDPGREQKDRFILSKVKSKMKMGGKLFIDLRYSRYWPKLSTDAPLDYVEGERKINELREEDPDFFVGYSFIFHKEQQVSYWHSLLGEPQDEIYKLLEKMSGDCCEEDDYNKYMSFQKRLSEKLENMGEEEKKKTNYPYIIFFDKKTRDHILDQHDILLNQYGFKKTQIFEINGRFNRVTPLQHPLVQNIQNIEESTQHFVTFGILATGGMFGIYQDMCFRDNVAEYEKVGDLK